MELESVFQDKLGGAAIADRVGDLAEVGAVRNTAIGSLVISNVKGVEEVGAEVEMLFMPDTEGFGNGHIDVLEARSTEEAGMQRAKGVV